MGKKITTLGGEDFVNGAGGGFETAGRSVRLFLTCLILGCVGFIAADAQTPDTVRRIVGKVIDQNGATVAGATVAVAKGNAKITKTSTDMDGEFMFAVMADEYILSVTAPGFEAGWSAVNLNSNLALPPIVLRIKWATANVTVSDDAAPYITNAVKSATKTFTPLRDVPQAVTVIEKEQIRDQMMSSIGDVVRYVPGVTAHQGENNRDDVVIRGNRSSADFYLDGVRDDVQYYRDLYNLERVETIKGPNAMIFGRGGGGGVINRVTKEAGFTPTREFTLQGGSFYNRRLTGDVNQPIGSRSALRLNGLYENSDSYRKYVNLQRTGLNPTFTFLPDSKTHVTIAYEFLRDRRTADRGITSFQGRPVDVPISTFYGDPANSRVRSNVNIVSGAVDRVFGDLIFRNRTHYGDYGRFYQNYVPGAVNTARTLVTLTAYNNATRRRNFFNQTDLNYSLRTGGVRHTLAFGTEFGNQRTRNLRNTGFFNNTLASALVPFDAPQTNSPITFRPNATDANNRLRLNLAAAYVQDQIELSRYVQIIAGVRYDYFDLKYHNNRNGETLGRVDKLVSPRFGIVLKPVTVLSIYVSRSLSYLPSSGDQFSSLTTVTQQVKPEKFTNIEAGVKWDIRRDLFLTTALYRLDRTNTRSTDPNDPSRIIQTGSQRTDGFEIGLTGSIVPRWTISGGYAWQNARITNATVSAALGKQVGQVPHNTFSLWNKYQLSSRLGAGIGIIYRSDMFAAIDNTVVLPGYLKADAAVFYNLSEHWRLQANLENITNTRYYANADSNTNISPGSPRGLKVGIVARF